MTFSGEYITLGAPRRDRLVPKSVWSVPYDQINGFEKLMAENNVVMFKFFLHISKEHRWLFRNLAVSQNPCGWDDGMEDEIPAAFGGCD